VQAKLSFGLGLNLLAWGLTLSQIVLAFNICFCFYGLGLLHIESEYTWLNMKNIWPTMSMGLLACGIRLVAKREFINFWLRVVMRFLA
jgi:hypothetical protein